MVSEFQSHSEKVYLDSFFFFFLGGLELWKIYTQEVLNTAWNCGCSGMFQCFFSISCVASHKYNMQNPPKFKNQSVTWQVPVAKTCPIKRVSIHLCSMKKSSGGSAQTCGLNFFRTISTLIIFSNEQFLDFYFRQASFLWRVRENDKGVTRNNSIIECPNENACRHEEECCAFDSLPIFNFPMDI